MAARVVVSYDNLRKIDENKMYRNRDISKLLGVHTSWLPDSCVKWGLPYIETDKRAGNGAKRRLYKGKDIVDVVLAHAIVTEKLNNPSPAALSRPLVYDIKKGFVITRNGDSFSIQEAGQSAVRYPSKLACLWAMAKIIWGMNK